MRVCVGGAHGFILGLCGAIPAKSSELHVARTPQLTAHSDGWFDLLSASRLNATLLSLLSALTMCLKLLNGLSLELKAPWRL